MTQQSAAAQVGASDPRSEEFVDALAAFLIERNALDELAVHRAQRAQKQSGERFDLVLTRLGLLPDVELARLLAEFLGVPLAEAKDLPQVPLLAEHLQLNFLASNRLIPLSEDGETIVVATADPFNTDPIAAIGFLLGRPVEARLMAASIVERAIQEIYGRAGALGPEQEAGAGQASDEDVRRLEDLASEAPIIRLAHDLITRAVDMQASDIHVEPREDSLRVRYRLDGMLHTIETLPLSVRAAVTSRIKIMAQLNIAERRLPQDGRIKTTVHGREIDLRVSTMPTLCGESVVLRILDRSSVQLDFQALGFAGPAHEAFCQAARSAERHHPRYRAHRQRQDHHALHRVERPQHCRAQDLYRRGPDRVPARGRQSDPGAAQDRPQLRVRSALHPASGSRYHHGGRDPRPGDGTNVDPGLAHGTSGAFNRAHQQRLRHCDAAARHGAGGLSAVIDPDRGARPAPGPPAVPGVRGAVAGFGAAARTAAAPA
jgi:hypothetical protein